MLENINSPADIKGLEPSRLDELCAEIRETILNTASSNGGHLASNLGVVEATVALHLVFDAPFDTLLFDTGHQCYAHKLLTGRYKDFHTLRQYGGMSGFPNPSESEYDALYAGHCGSSVSAALGIAEANAELGSSAYTVVMIGDGEIGNGMVYEALNNCADKDIRLIILLNDNEMSISKSTGGLHRYLSRIRTSRGYYRAKRRTIRLLSHIPLLGKPLSQLAAWIKRIAKSAFSKPNLFECLGVDYLGPVDGGDIEKLSVVLREAKERRRCCIVHMITKKGKGYQPAEEHPEDYHSVGAIPVKTAVKPTFSSEFGKILCDMARSDDRICAVTAAMCGGTGLKEFSKLFPDRFFDSGIAEEHAVAFCGGLSYKGMLPVCALYSTFSQRCFDQLFHDIALQKARLVLALDRAGVVEDDGITHQGIYDVSLFSTLPGVRIYAPALFSELDLCLHSALNSPGLSVVRYPKGGEPGLSEENFTKESEIVFSKNVSECETVVVTYGRIAENVEDAVRGVSGPVGIIRLIKLFPLDFATFDTLTAKAKRICFIEEGVLTGGIGEKSAAHLSECRPGVRIYVKAIEIPPAHGKINQLFTELGFSRDEIAGQLARNMKA